MATKKNPQQGKLSFNTQVIRCSVSQSLARHGDLHMRPTNVKHTKHNNYIAITRTRTEIYNLIYLYNLL